MHEFLSYFHINDANILTRIILSIVLGFGIGLERELTNKWAGLRTHMLVCLGSCLFTIISIYGFSTALTVYPVGDPGRVAAQVLTGIGFIGGGTVLRHGASVSGLTTAATLWMVASIGMACGCGRFDLAIVSTILSAGVLVLIRIFEKEFIPNSLKNFHKLKVSLVCDEDAYTQVQQKIFNTFSDIFEVSKKPYKDSETQLKISFKLSMNSKTPIEDIHEKFNDTDLVDSISVQEIYEQ